MKRTVIYSTLAAALVVTLVFALACGDDGEGGLSVLEGGAASATASAGASPAASPTPPSPEASDEPEPVMSGESEDPFGDASGEATAADLEAYLAAAKPIYREVVRIQKIAGAMLVEVSQVADDSWDVAADRTQAYADQLAMQESLWLDVTPPNGLQEAHQAQANALATEVEMLELLAAQLRSRTWNVVKGTKDVNRLSDEAKEQRAAYRAGVEAMAQELGVTVPWKWPAW